MNALHIKPEGKKKIVASISSNNDGTFRIEAKDKKLKALLTELVEKCCKENPVFGYVTCEYSPTGVIGRVKKTAKPTDPEYLRFLGRCITKGAITFIVGEKYYNLSEEIEGK